MVEFSSIQEIIILTFVLNNVLLGQFLGLEEVTDLTKKPSSIIGLFVSLITVLPLLSMIIFGLYNSLLIGYEHFTTLVIIVVSTVFIGLFMFIIKSINSDLLKESSVLKRLFTSTLVLGILIFNIGSMSSLLDTFLYSVFVVLGYITVLVLLTFIEKALEQSNIPSGYKGIPLQLIILGIIGLILNGLV